MFVLFTDTDCDVTPKIAKELGYELISMPYTIGDETIYPYVDFKEFDYKGFYKTLKSGIIPKTYAISPGEYIKYFEPVFESGNDILYVHFSKAMSGTFNAMAIAYEELLEKYPERKLYTIDTKGITILSNIIVKEIGDMYLNGKTAFEIMEWAEKEIDHYATYFFADNLTYFKRSGRVSNLKAAMGNLIGFKPILYMDEKGTMTNIGKERGRTRALHKLVSYVENLSVDIDKHRIIIGHTDALELALKLGEMLRGKFGENLNIEYVVVNPTAGSHCGPDAIGVAFYAKHK